MLSKLELSYDKQLDLKIMYEKNIEFLSTAFDLDSLDLLNNMNLKRFKILGEITNLLFEENWIFSKSIILSTGMSNMEEIRNALNQLNSAGTIRKNISICIVLQNIPLLFRR